MNPVPRVSVVDDATLAHLLQLYAGLHELAADGRLRLVYRPSAQDLPGERVQHLFWVDVEAAGTGTGRRRLCFDMHDGERYASLEALRLCDLYFKRSYSSARAQELPEGLGVKVRPYGLNCFLVGSRDTALAWRAVRAFLARRRTPRPMPWGEMRDWVVRAVSRGAPGFLQSLFRNHLAARDVDLARPQAQLGDRVCFQTRLWDSADADQDPAVEELNHGRVALTRLLRDHFKDRFVGGLVRTPLAVRRHPDLISPFPTQQRAYLDLLSQSRVSVVSAGLHRSIPWKMAESLAAGRCVVAEPLSFELPAPLVEGRHLLTFRGPEECVGHCERLLKDDELARSMQQLNRQYYRDNVAPAAVVGNCLRQAGWLPCPASSPG